MVAEQALCSPPAILHDMQMIAKSATAPPVSLAKAWHGGPRLGSMGPPLVRLQAVPQCMLSHVILITRARPCAQADLRCGRSLGGRGTHPVQPACLPTILFSTCCRHRAGRHAHICSAVQAAGAVGRAGRRLGGRRCARPAGPPAHPLGRALQRVRLAGQPGRRDAGAETAGCPRHCRRRPSVPRCMPVTQPLVPGSPAISCQPALLLPSACPCMLLFAAAESCGTVTPHSPAAAAAAAACSAGTVSQPAAAAPAAEPAGWAASSARLVAAARPPPQQAAPKRRPRCERLASRAAAAAQQGARPCATSPQRWRGRAPSSSRLATLLWRIS